MKKSILAMLVLVAGSSFATSLKTVNIRLQAVTTPVASFHGRPISWDKAATVITVNANGEVKGAKCTEKTDTRLGVGRRYYTNCHDIQILQKLTASEIRRMESQIKEASTGEIEFPNPNGMVCLAMPTHGYNYTANNGLVLLSIGTAPCGHSTFNKSAAAKSLIQSLEQFEAKYN